MSVHVSEKNGVDSLERIGSVEDPFCTAAFALYAHEELNKGEPKLLVFKAEENRFEEISASALKKAKKGAESLKKKVWKQKELEAKKQDREAEKAAKQLEAIDIKIEEDSSLQVAHRVKINKAYESVGQRIKVYGWIHRIRNNKKLVFVVLRDGLGFLQSVLTGKLALAKQTQELTLESSVALYGTINRVPEGKSAPGGVELAVDYYEIIGLAPGGEDAITNKINEKADPSLLLDQRHLALRGETLSAVMKVRAIWMRSLRKFYDIEGLTEVTPPCMVQTQVEGGSTLFKLNYYDEEAFLTQSSQLYLETCLASLGDVYSVQESFRAEKSHTRRHLSEYTHSEAELAFITFDDLLTHLEKLFVETVGYVLNDPIGHALVEQLNPDFKAPTYPFKRLDYKDALEWLNEHNVPNEDGKKFKFGDDIAEAAERKMVDTMGVPIFLIRFPAEIKSFYMPRCKDDPRVTESVDVLMPNVGEITGGSMRTWAESDLLEGYRREKIDPAPYYWYLDQRKYGSVPHGGYGLGTERILAWLCNRYTVRDCSLYPRFTGRCKP